MAQEINANQDASSESWQNGAFISKVLFTIAYKS
jgi:hypothetical protein